ncbi:DUF4129 domain-containing protein [Candidatus Mycobacterium methanotrophicum]|uniref:DUF4129 domain-containing protein n=1 Tax=Candidatus Mycobacterium methanotrophicum TaxID=2943498 RepID=A0ABY4QM42_9MYCO|nr:DUF4129 domain-containing protein [Candidatus Mycobacterium methanotrophicum]UQX11681.1 DUF4129 domain-containing protein [Candidatus Mycobacterium methanotrophicum]
MFDKATGRVVAVIVLLIVIAASLRGYLPGVERAAPKRPPDSGSSLVYVIAMLSVSVIILAVAIILRLRNPRRAGASAGALPQRFSGGRSRPAWQVLVIGAAVLVAWLLTVWLLSRFIVVHTVGQTPTAPASNAPAPAKSVPPPQQPRDTGGDRDMLRYLITTAVALLALVVAGAVVAARRRRGGEALMVAAEPPPPPAMPMGASGSLERAAELGLAEIGDRSREPREAIIACYAAMERELAYVPGAAPQDFDTPTEVLARAVENCVLHVDNASELVNLFEEARFSPHVMSEAHRESALRVLQLVLAELRSLV